MNWYILSTKLGYEQRVVKNLTKKYEAYLPLHQLTDEQKGRVLQPLFPGYVFVHAKAEQLREVAMVKGVANIVYYGDRYALVHEEDIQLLEKFLQHYTLVQEEKIAVDPEEKANLSDTLAFGGSSGAAGEGRRLVKLRLPALGSTLLAESKVVKGEKVQIGKAYVNNVTPQEAILEIERLIASNAKTYVVTPNLDHIVKLEQDPEFERCYAHAGLVLADGNPLIWASKVLGTPLKALVTGSDLFPALCQHAAERGHRVYFLGGLEGVAEKAAVNLTQKFPGLQVVGTYSPPFGFDKDDVENGRILDMVNAVKPHLLFVGVGAPKQEKWMFRNLEYLNINVALGIGASFDFEAGTIKRAPKPVRDMRMEWFWRFSSEPTRLFKRYFVDSNKFIPIIYRQLEEKRKAEGSPAKPAVLRELEQSS